MTPETMTNVFAAIGFGACVWLAAVLVLRRLRRSRLSSLPPVVGAAPEAAGVPAAHVVAITAAVAASGYRVVHIADPASGSAWASEGRRIHQTSHRPH